MKTSFLALLACSALVAADANKVVGDFNQINADLTRLDLDINLVTSGVTGIGQALQVSVDSVTVDNDLIATSNDVNSSDKFTAGESSNVVDAIERVAGTANRTLADLNKQYGTFAGLAPVVLSSLYQLRQDQNNLGFALAGKLDQSQINRGVKLLLGLNAATDASIAIYAVAPAS